MAIEKALYQAPLGIDQLSEDEGQEPALEIVIEDPESVEIGVDGEPILRIDDEEEEDDFGANLAEEMSDSKLQSLASDLIEDFDGDIGARKDWIQTYVDGLEL